MRLLRSAKNVVDKDKNEKIVPKFESVKLF